MQRRQFLRKSAAIGTVGIAGFTSQATAGSISVDLVIENKGTDKVEYDISFKNSGLSDISGTVKSSVDDYSYNEYIRFDEVRLKGVNGRGWSYPEAEVRVSGDHSTAHGTCVVESLWNSNQYEIDFLHDVDGTSDNELGDSHSGNSCSGTVNEGHTDTWDFEGHATRIESFGSGEGLNKFTFTYD